MGNLSTKKKWVLVGKELDDAIYEVVKDGNVSGLRELLETYDDVTERDIYYDLGWKALHVSTWKGYVDVAKLLILNGAAVNAVDSHNKTSLHVAGQWGCVDVAKLLIQNGAYVNAVDEDNYSVLSYASSFKKVPLTLELLCLGAKIDKNALEDDMTGLLAPIEERLEKLRNSERFITNLCSNEENKFMWNLAFCLTLKAKVPAFKVYYKVCSFITYHGIFMASGYDLGKESIWRK
jgi:ankyrin repeat protein